jgi:hypothetical protein
VLNWIRNGILDFYVQYFRLEMLKKTKQNKKTKTKQKTKQNKTKRSGRIKKVVPKKTKKKLVTTCQRLLGVVKHSLDFSVWPTTL